MSTVLGTTRWRGVTHIIESILRLHNSRFVAVFAHFLTSVASDLFQSNGGRLVTSPSRR